MQKHGKTPKYIHDKFFYLKAAEIFVCMFYKTMSAFKHKV